MSHCPSCGRFVGPYEACPYCGARLSGRIPIRAIKIAAVALATVGLAVLWFATRAEVPRVQIGQAGSIMNMAYVRVQGRCTRTPTYDPQGAYLSFRIDDGTGEMLVSAYRAETRALVEQGRVPALGDEVEVAEIRFSLYTISVSSGWAIASMSRSISQISGVPKTSEVSINRPAEPDAISRPRRG